MLKCLFKFTLKLFIVFWIVVLIPGLPPYPAFPFESFSVVKPQPIPEEFVGNNILNNATRLFEGKLKGPEHLLARGNLIFTGTKTGEVVKIEGNRDISTIATFGKPCSGKIDEHICGRPLGMSFDTITDNLIVADTYYGIYEVNYKTGDTIRLVAPDDIINGADQRKPKFFNSVAIAQNGDIYWTDSSSDFPLSEWVYEGFSNPSGRLIHYSRSERKNTVLFDKLWFANGLALSKNEEFLVVNELMAARIHKCYMKGEKQGECEIFAEGLPGLPDNITPDEDGFWVALVAPCDTENPNLLHNLNRMPYVRKFIVRTLYMFKNLFQFIHNIYASPVTEVLIETVRNLPALTTVDMNRSILMRFDWNGNVIDVIHGDQGKVHTVSHVLEVGDYLYLGSPFTDFIGKVKFEREKIHPSKEKKS